MNKIYAFPVATLLLLLFLSNPVMAQFEGKITFDSYEVTKDGSKQQNDHFSMYVTHDRIFLKGENQYDFGGSIQTEGILVRLDQQDFVFFTGENTALKISKQDINSMMNMFSNSNSSNSRDMEVDYEKTGETTTLQGYDCEKFIFRDEENSDDYAVVWMTDQLDVNWGMLAEPWGNGDMDMWSDEFSTDLIFKDGYFPMKVESYEDGNLNEVTEVNEISESNIASSMVEVPQDVQVLSFQDYLFNNMSRQ